MLVVQNLLSMSTREVWQMPRGCVEWSHRPLRFDIAGKLVLGENGPVQT